MTLHFAPPLPILVTLIVVGFVLSMSARMAWRQRTTRRTVAPNLLRMLTLCALSFLLFNPYLTQKTHRPERAPLLFLLDSSRSMNTPDADNTTRWRRAKANLTQNAELLKTLAANYDVKLFTFAKQAQPRKLDELANIQNADGDATHLADALLATSASGNPQTGEGEGTPQAFGGLVLLSDGADTGNADPLAAARQCRANGLPVFTVTIGQEWDEPTLQVTATRPQVFAAPGQPAEIGAEIQSEGITTQNANVTLTREGQATQTRTIRIRNGRTPVRFTVTERAKGFYRYRIRVSPVEGVSDNRSNAATVALSVLDAKTRVLLLEGEPSWDSKFTANALRSDPTIQLDAVYLLMANRPIAQSGTQSPEPIRVPQTLEQFARYDVLVLGKGYAQFFDATATANLKRWISERGGSLVLLRGSPEETTDALRDLEPFAYTPEQIEAARAQLTDAGKAYPGFAQPNHEDTNTIVRKLPLLITSAKVTGEKAMATVLARTEGGTSDRDAEKEMALIAWQRVGQGKVMAIAGDGLWRWAMLPPELAQYSSIFPEFWAQTIRYLASGSDFLPGQNLTITTSRSTYAPQEQVDFTITRRNLPDPNPPVLVVRDEQGKETNVLLSAGRPENGATTYTAHVTAAHEGDYSATATQTRNSKQETAVALYRIVPPIAERIGQSANPALMRQIAEAGGGETLAPDELNLLPTKLRTLERATRTRETRHELIQSRWVLCLLVGLLGMEWFLRRRG